MGCIPETHMPILFEAALHELFVCHANLRHATRMDRNPFRAPDTVAATRDANARRKTIEALGGLIRTVNLSHWRGLSQTLKQDSRETDTAITSFC